MARHNETGVLGEQVAAQYYINHGHQIVGTNYLKSFGEIDIITTRAGRTYFVEVKAVSYETKEIMENNVSRETYRLVDRVHTAKQQKLKRVIASYLTERSVSDFQIDIALVRLVPSEQYASVEIIANVIV